jgi:hypothetical protein
MTYFSVFPQVDNLGCIEFLNRESQVRFLPGAPHLSGTDGHRVHIGFSLRKGEPDDRAGAFTGGGQAAGHHPPC